MIFKTYKIKGIKSNNMNKNVTTNFLFIFRHVTVSDVDVRDKQQGDEKHERQLRVEGGGTHACRLESHEDRIHIPSSHVCFL